MKNSIAFLLCLIFSFALAGEKLTYFSKKNNATTKNCLIDIDDKSEKEKSSEEDSNTYTSLYVQTSTNELNIPVSVLIKSSIFQVIFTTSAYSSIIYSPPETTI